MTSSDHRLCSRGIGTVTALILIVLAAGAVVSFVRQCGSSAVSSRVINGAHLDLLTDQPFLLPCHTLDGTVKAYRLNRWDLIFLGWHFRERPKGGEHAVAAAIPGPYDHAMVYLGKDENGLAYVAELTTHPDGADLSPDGKDVYWAGRLYIRALGTDELRRRHKSSSRFFDGKTYNHAVVRALSEEDRTQLNSRTQELIAQIRADVLRGIRFQIPVEFDFQRLADKNELVLDDDGYENGAFCVDYWMELYGKVGGVCFRGTRMNAADIVDYLINDPAGEYAKLSDADDPTGRGGIDLQVFAKNVTILDPPAHVCPVDGHTETGLVTPSRLFASPDLMDPEEIVVSNMLTTTLPLCLRHE